MKKIIVFTLVAFFAVASYAQNRKVVSATLDTVKGAETVYFDFNTSGIGTKNYELAFQALNTQIGGTSDGKITLQMSVDGTSFVTYANAANDDFVTLYAADSSKVANNGNEFTITSGGVFGGIIQSTPFEFYRLKAVGTSGDTTAIQVKYQLVEKK